MENQTKNTLISPIRKFFSFEGFEGFLLIFATVVAIIAANSPWAATYEAFWQTPITFTIGEEGFSKPLLLWVNDGLMTIFFFLVGLEIKRELIAGELATFRRASLPFVAALGGILVPIGLFFVFNHENAGQEAWGVPMATDIAFSLGILSLLGSRTPSGLIVFLTAFAIVDDIGAILVIVLFYAHEVHWFPLGIAAGLFGLLLLCNLWLKISRNWVYLLIGIFIWYYLFKSGIHPTIAGVLVALTIPAKNVVKRKTFLDSFQNFLKKIRNKESTVELTRRFHEERELDELYRLKHNLKGVMPPLQRLEFRLEEFVSHFVIPVFALANAGISLDATGDAIFQGLTLSIMGAMVLGKLLGIFGFTWISVKLGITDLPANTRWIHILGIALLGGVGFTMAIFISNLSIEDAVLLRQAKLGILTASFIAGLFGYLLLRYTLPKKVD